MNYFFETRRILQERIELILKADKAASQFKNIIHAVLEMTDEQISELTSLSKTKILYTKDLTRLCANLKEVNIITSPREIIQMLSDLRYVYSKMNLHLDNRPSGINPDSNSMIGLLTIGRRIGLLKDDGTLLGEPSDLFDERMIALKAKIGLEGHEPISVGEIQLIAYLKNIEDEFKTSPRWSSLYIEEINKFSKMRRPEDRGFRDYMYTRFAGHGNRSPTSSAKLKRVYHEAIDRVRAGKFNIRNQDNFLGITDDMAILFGNGDIKVGRESIYRLLAGGIKNPREYNPDAISFVELRSVSGLWQREPSDEILKDTLDASATDLNSYDDPSILFDLSESDLIDVIMEPLVDIIDYEPFLDEAIISVLEYRSDMVLTLLEDSLISQFEDFHIISVYDNPGLSGNVTEYVYRLEYDENVLLISTDLQRAYSNYTGMMVPLLDEFQNWNSIVLNETSLPDFSIRTSGGLIMKSLFNYNYYLIHLVQTVKEVYNDPIGYFIASSGDIDYLMAQYEMVKVRDILNLGSGWVFGRGDEAWTGGEMAISLYYSFMIDAVNDESLSNDVRVIGISHLNSINKGIKSFISVDYVNSIKFTNSNLNSLIETTGIGNTDDIYFYHEFDDGNSLIFDGLSLSPVDLFGNLMNSPLRPVYSPSYPLFGSLQQYYGSSDRFYDPPYMVVTKLIENVVSSYYMLNEIYDDGDIVSKAIERLLKYQSFYKFTSFGPYGTGTLASLGMQSYLDRYGLL